MLLRGILLLFFLAIAFGNRASAEEKSVLGDTSHSEGALIGIFYDLKKNQDQTTAIANYPKVVDDFLSQGWNEAVLNNYYRVSKPLYTTQIFVPIMGSDAVPKAFGIEGLVKGSHWVAHYKGQVSPPSAGTYRFWGYCDDVIAVAADEKTILVNNRKETKLPQISSQWKPSGPDGARASNGLLRPGDWIDLKKGQIIDLDILIGDNPGGYFNAFLMIEKKGETYETDKEGHPILPIFQVAA